MRYLIDGKIIKQNELLADYVPIVEDRIIKITAIRKNHEYLNDGEWFLHQMSDGGYKWFDKGTIPNSKGGSAFKTLGEALYRIEECSSRVLFDDEDVHDSLF